MLKKNEQYSIRYLRFREAFYDEYEEEIEADKMWEELLKGE